MDKSKIWIRIGAINKTYKVSIRPTFSNNKNNEIKIDLQSEYTNKTIGQVAIIFNEYDLKRLFNSLNQIMNEKNEEDI